MRRPKWVGVGGTRSFDILFFLTFQRPNPFLTHFYLCADYWAKFNKNKYIFMLGHYNYINFGIVWNFEILSFSPITRFCERKYGIFRNIPCVKMKISKLTKYLGKKKCVEFSKLSRYYMIVRNLAKFIHLQMDWLHDQLLDFKVLHIQKLLGKKSNQKSNTRM